MARFSQWSARVALVVQQVQVALQEMANEIELKRVADSDVKPAPPWLSPNDLGDRRSRVLFLEGLDGSGSTSVLAAILTKFLAENAAPSLPIRALRIIQVNLIPKGVSIHEAVLVRLCELAEWFEHHSLLNKEVTRGLILEAAWHLRRARESRGCSAHPGDLANNNAFRDRWMRFITRFSAHMRGLPWFSGMRLLIIPLEGVTADRFAPEDFRFLDDLYHPELCFILSGHPINTGWPSTRTVQRYVPPNTRFQVPLVSAAEALAECFPEEAMSGWMDLLRPFEHKHVAGDTKEILLRSKYGFSAADLPSGTAEGDRQIDMASVLLLAKNEVGTTLFSPTRTWQIALKNVGDDSAVTLKPVAGSSVGRSGVAWTTSVSLATTIRISRDGVDPRVDELEIFALVAGVVSPASYHWVKSAQTQLIRSSINTIDGHLSIGWPSWTPDSSASLFIRRAQRAWQLSGMFLAAAKAVQSTEWLDHVVRMWVVMQIAEFEDSTSDKQLGGVGPEFAFSRGFRISSYHNHGNIGALRQWMTDWLPVLTSPEFGLPDITCQELLRAAIAHNLTDRQGHARGTNQLIRRWLSGRDLLILNGRWSGQAERPSINRLTQELYEGTGSFLGRVGRLCGFGAELHRILKGAKESFWGTEKKLDARDLKIFRAVLESCSDETAFDLDSLIRAGLSFAAFSAVEDYALSHVVFATQRQ